MQETCALCSDRSSLMLMYSWSVLLNCFKVMIFYWLCCRCNVFRTNSDHTLQYCSVTLYVLVKQCCKDWLCLRFWAIEAGLPATHCSFRKCASLIVWDYTFKMYQTELVPICLWSLLQVQIKGISSMCGGKLRTHTVVQSDS